MNEHQENQLLTILSDFIPVIDGDIIQGIFPEAKHLTRQKILEQLKAEREELSKEDISLVSWQEENIQLLEEISDEDFQAVVKEKIMMTEIQIGHSLFQPFSEKQLELLAEKIKSKQELTPENELQVEEKQNQKSSLLQKMLRKLC